jgi:hypothetical protein|mmetsp:Transcript_51114/g.85505  ORF Transcript_51114/g.85505 Transcript_51114/m.85505 type:complete len:94 (+) Transcript_51114:189-470(+)
MDGVQETHTQHIQFFSHSAVPAHETVTASPKQLQPSHYFSTHQNTIINKRDSMVCMTALPGHGSHAPKSGNKRQPGGWRLKKEDDKGAQDSPN